MNRLFAIAIFGFVCLLIPGCSSKGDSKAAPKATAPVSGIMMAENRKHPLAKYLEIAGLRLSERGGKVTVQLAVINHSDADIADLGLNVALKPTTAKPEDPPFCTFSVKLKSLAPQEVANTTGECATKLRVYELPDWQFIHATYEIVSPAP